VKAALEQRKRAEDRLLSQQVKSSVGLLKGFKNGGAEKFIPIEIVGDGKLMDGLLI